MWQPGTAPPEPPSVRNRAAGDERGEPRAFGPPKGFLAGPTSARRSPSPPATRHQYWRQPQQSQLSTNSTVSKLPRSLSVSDSTRRSRVIGNNRLPIGRRLRHPHRPRDDRLQHHVSEVG